MKNGDRNTDNYDEEDFVRLKKADFQKICKTITSLKGRITELEMIYNCDKQRRQEMKRIEG